MSLISNNCSRTIVSMAADAQTTTHPEADWHALTSDEVLEELQSHGDGLSSDEVLQRREKYGMNKLAEKPPVPAWKKFLEQFQDPMVYPVSYTHLTLPTKA